jgi:DNA invertase Pin-like site-specific DNA recombinase
MFSNRPLVPKNPDGVLRVISIGRLSQPKETEAATQQSLDAIQRENEWMLKSIHSGPIVVKYLAEQISGMLANRETMAELWKLVASGEWDLIIAEDLSRIFRNPAFQLMFLQQCADSGIRVICFADNLDTADESWESAALLATARHGLMIPDTRRRIKRTATESFKRGGMVLRVKFGFAKVSTRAIVHVPFVGRGDYSFDADRR